MGLCHKSVRNVERFLEHGPRIGRLGRLVEAFRTYAAPSALSLGILVWAGCWVGRRVYTTFQGRKVYPNMFAFLVGPTTACDVVLRIIQHMAPTFGEAVRIVHMGIRNALSLVYIVRDDWVRSERQFTEVNEPARFSRVQVDDGEPERRILITQWTLAAILGRKGNTGTSLAETLIESSNGRDLAVFMSPRDGGHLRASGPHISVFSRCSRAEAAAMPASLIDVCFFAESQMEPTFRNLRPAQMNELNSFIVDSFLALGDVAGEIPLDPEALQTIEDAVRAFPPTARASVATTMVKLSLTLAVLDSCSAIDGLHAATAAQFLTESRRVLGDCEASESQTHIHFVARRIEDALREHPQGLSGAQVSDLFSRNLKRGALKAAKELLVRQIRATVEYSPTDGRPREHWRIGGPA